MQSVLIPYSFTYTKLVDLRVQLYHNYPILTTVLQKTNLYLFSFILDLCPLTLI